MSTMNPEQDSPDQPDSVDSENRSVEGQAQVLDGLDGLTRDADVAQTGRGSMDSNTSRESVEIGGPKGLEPTRYGDWEKNGRCIDF